MQITLLRNRLVIKNKKVTKRQNETIHADKEENEKNEQEHDENIHTAGHICGT